MESEGLGAAERIRHECGKALLVHIGVLALTRAASRATGQIGPPTTLAYRVLALTRGASRATCINAA